MSEQNDRERILMNIAAMLASELHSLQMLPAVRDYYARSSHQPITTESSFAEDTKYEKGDLVVCWTSAGRQENPFIVSFVERAGSKYDERGLLLRAIGTDQTCWYGNESFVRLRGIPDRLLWEGVRKETAMKIQKAFRKLDEMWHVFRGIEFDSEQEDLARVFVGERYGGLSNPTKPYIIEIRFTKTTTIKSIVQQMKDQNYGTRKFEPLNDDYDGPMEGLTVMTRASLMNELGAKGIDVSKLQ